MKKMVPRVGQVFESREKLEDELVTSGWTAEGLSTALKEGKVVGYNIGVQDLEKDLWLMVNLKPFKGKVKVTKVKKLKISDFKGPPEKPKKKKRKRKKLGPRAKHAEGVKAVVRELLREGVKPEDITISATQNPQLKEWAEREGIGFSKKQKFDILSPGMGE